MKTILRIYAMPIFFIMALVGQVEAQSRRISATKTVKTTRTTVKTTKRIPSTKVVYKKPKRKVVSVRTLPSRTVITHRGQNYYYSNNKFYTLARGRYIVIAPKVGFRVKTLPPNYKRIHFNNHIYFNVDGIFYIQVNNEYEVVDPEIGTIVYELPEDYEKVEIDGLTYYEYANVLYEKVQVDGTRAYEVVGIIDME